MTLSEIIKALENNPVYRLSLGSKELFHSNMVAWLLESYPDSPVSELFGLDKYEKKDVKREENHTDISVDCGDARVIIENKVKSLPDKNQLLRYSEKETKKKKINQFYLLSLFEPDFNDGIISNAANIIYRWNYVSYKELGDAVKRLEEKPKDEQNDDLEHHLVNAYGDVCLDLDKVSSEILDNIKLDKPLPVSNKIFLEKLKKIHFEPVYHKVAADFMARELINKMKIKYIPPYSITAGRKVGNYEENAFTIGSGFVSRGQKGIIEMKYTIDKYFCMGIQVEGDQYRFLIEGTDTVKSSVEPFFKALAEKIGTFPFLQYPEKEKGRKRTYVEYCAYGNTFFYKYGKISEMKNDGQAMPMGELIDSIVDHADVFLELAKNKDILEGKGKEPERVSSVT